MDQFQRDVLELLRFSLESPPSVAPLFFPMFRREEIQALYEIPLETRRRIWEGRHKRPSIFGSLQSQVGGNRGPD